MSVSVSVLQVKVDGGWLEKGLRWYSTVQGAQAAGDAAQKTDQVRVILDPIGWVAKVCSEALADKTFDHISQYSAYDQFTRLAMRQYFPEGDDKYKRVEWLIGKLQGLERKIAPLQQKLTVVKIVHFVLMDGVENLKDGKKYLKMITDARIRVGQSAQAKPAEEAESIVVAPPKDETWGQWGWRQAKWGGSVAASATASGYNAVQRGACGQIETQLAKYEETHKFKAAQFSTKAALKGSVKLAYNISARFLITEFVSRNLIDVTPGNASLGKSVAIVQIVVSTQAIGAEWQKGLPYEKVARLIVEQAVKIMGTCALFSLVDDYLPERNPYATALIFFQVMAYYEVLYTWMEHREREFKSTKHVSKIASYLDVSKITTYLAKKGE